jgi:hypothetical protein
VLVGWAGQRNDEHAESYEDCEMDRKEKGGDGAASAAGNLAADLRCLG